MASVLQLFTSIVFAVLAWIAMTGSLAAGAFLLPEGQGQFIAGVGYSRH